MNKTFTYLCLFTLLTACGGGGGDGGGNVGPGPGSSLTLDSAPTANIAGSQDNAKNSTAEIQGTVPDLVESVSVQSPLGIGSVAFLGNAAAPIAATSTTPCSSGSFTVDSNISGGGVQTGSSISFVYIDCLITIGGATTLLNGSGTMIYTRFVNYNDFAMTITYSNFTMTYTSPSLNYSYGPFNVSYNFDNANGTITTSYTLSNGGVTNITKSKIKMVSKKVTITSGKYVYNSPILGGIVSVEFNNWTYDTELGHPISGSFTITGANGTVMVEATGTGYTVTYNIGGSVTAYTVTY